MPDRPDFSLEAAKIKSRCPLVAGVDEVGRGPLCGPVLAAAVRLDPDRIPEGLNDSKKLSAPRRAELFESIMASADVSHGQASVAEIDRLNILRASHLAMMRAVAALDPAPDYLLIDGNLLPRGLTLAARALVRGDSRRLDRGQMRPRPAHGGFGATAPRLWLGDQYGLSVKKPHCCAARSRRHPTP